jgi:short-subunit dehydrogenase
MKEIDNYTYGPWALVTGASSGIGEEFARQAAANGLNVVLVARREERLNEIAAELTAHHGVETRVLPVNLADDGAFKAIVEGTDGLDIGLVISNAGAGNPGPFISLPHDRLREIVRLNVFAHLDLAHHFGKKLAERGRGGLVLVSAVAAAGGLPFMANDSATKAYVLNLGEALHVELREAGVNVTVLVPVLVNTPVVARIGLDKIGLSAEAITPEQAVDEALTALLANQATTLGRADMSEAFEGMKRAVVEMIKTRLEAAQPAH